MTPEAVLSIILATLGILGSAGFWGYRQSRKEAPIKKRDADLAVAETSQQMALAVAIAAREDNVTLRADLDKERSALQVLSGRVDELSSQVREHNHTISRLREALSTLSNAWDELAANWSTLRLKDEPPPKPTIKTH